MDGGEKTKLMDVVVGCSGAGLWGGDGVGRCQVISSECGCRLARVVVVVDDDDEVVKRVISMTMMSR
jgi:hypothetical protein